MSSAFSANLNEIIISEKTSDALGYRMTFFSTGTDAHTAQWDGARTPHSALTFSSSSHIGFGAHEALPISTFPNHLSSAISRCSQSHIYVDIPRSESDAHSQKRTSSKSILKLLASSSTFTSSIFQTLSKLGSKGNRKPLAPEIAKMRSIKSPAEQRVMRAAADISARAHAKVCSFYSFSCTLVCIYSLRRQCGFRALICPSHPSQHTSNTCARCKAPSDLHTFLWSLPGMFLSRNLIVLFLMRSIGLTLW